MSPNMSRPSRKRIIPDDSDSESGRYIPVTKIMRKRKLGSPKERYDGMPCHCNVCSKQAKPDSGQAAREDSPAPVQVSPRPRLEEQLEKIRLLECELKIVQQDLAESQQASSELRAQLREERRNRVKGKDDCIQLQKELEEVKGKLDGRDMRQQQRQRISDLENDKKKLEREAATMNAVILQLQTQNPQEEKTKSQLANTKRELCALKRMCDGERAEMARLKSQLQIAQSAPFQDMLKNLDEQLTKSAQDWVRLPTPPRTADHGTEAGVQTDDDGMANRLDDVIGAMKKTVEEAILACESTEGAFSKVTAAKDNLKSLEKRLLADSRGKI